MKRVNQLTAWFAIMFIGVTVMSWILNKMVSFLGVIFFNPFKGLGYLALGFVCVMVFLKLKIYESNNLGCV